MERVVETQQRIIYFLLSILIALGLTWIAGDASFNAPQKYVLFLLFFSINLWISEAIPPFAVGIMIVGFLVFTLGNPEINPHNENVRQYVNTWSNSVIWLLLGGFFLAEAMKKTGLDRDVFRLAVLRFSSRPRSILLRIMLATAVASMVMSNTATTAMMIASVMPLLAGLDRDSPFTKSLLIGIPAAAAIGGMGTIIGSPPNAIAVDTINRIDELPFKVGFLEWMAFGVPVALFLVFIMWTVLIRRFVPKVDRLDLSAIQAEEAPDPVEARETRLKKRIVLIVLGLTILLWLTERLHHLPASAVSGIPIIVLTMVSIVSGDDVRRLPWDTLMLVAGGLSLGLAIEQTGLAEYYVTKLAEIPMNFWLLTAVFALATVVFSNIMSNTATATILIPMAVLWSGPHPLILPVVIGLCASCALFLPVSTPPNAIAYSTGRIEQKDFRLGGSVIGLLGPVSIIVWIAVLSLAVL
jgi:sodium-dependent dicarboxylate transporter 2/3/5